MNYEHDTEYLNCVKDILENKKFLLTDRFLQHGTTTTKEHCIQVSYRSYRMCRKKGLDYVSAARAGLLHDFFLYDWHTYRANFHGYTHARAALLNAQKEFCLNDKEKNIILRHMWPLTPIPPKSKEGLILTWQDKYCSVIEVTKRMQHRLIRAWQNRFSRNVHSIK